MSMFDMSLLKKKVAILHYSTGNRSAEEALEAVSELKNSDYYRELESRFGEVIVIPTRAGQNILKILDPKTMSIVQG